VPGQHVCCSAGTLPDFRPKPNADGTCASHYVESGENCAALGAANSLTNAEIRAILGGTGSWQDSTGAVHQIDSYSSYFDQDSQSDIAVYESSQWVGYINDATKQDRTKLYKSLNMAGVMD
jgi:hypothetical protein